MALPAASFHAGGVKLIPVDAHRSMLHLVDLHGRLVAKACMSTATAARLGLPTVSAVWPRPVWTRPARVVDGPLFHRRLAVALVRIPTAKLRDALDEG